MGILLGSLSHTQKLQVRCPPKSTVRFQLNYDSLDSGLPERFHLKCFQGALNKISLAPLGLFQLSSLYMQRGKSGKQNVKQFWALKNLNKCDVKSIITSSVQLTEKNLWLQTKLYKMFALLKKCMKHLGKITWYLLLCWGWDEQLLKSKRLTWYTSVSESNAHGFAFLWLVILSGFSRWLLKENECLKA